MGFWRWVCSCVFRIKMVILVMVVCMREAIWMPCFFHMADHSSLGHPFMVIHKKKSLKVQKKLVLHWLFCLPCIVCFWHINCKHVAHIPMQIWLLKVILLGFWIYDRVHIIGLYEVLRCIAEFRS